MFKNIIKYYMQKNSKFENFVRKIQENIRQYKVAKFKQTPLNEREILHALTVAKVHDKTFSQYKNCHFGKDIAIIATGPSLNKYIPLDNVINIGLNKAIFYEKIKLDYVFMQDYDAVKGYINELENEKFNNVTKFFGIAPEAWLDSKTSIVQCIIPEQLIYKLGAKEYFQHSKNFMPPKFYKDIDCNYIECGGSVAFSAIQFALYTNPRKIYLVGCDCTFGHYDENLTGKTKKNKIFQRNWVELKKFRDIYYPETEIISVNPVGLRGLFIDLDQEKE